MKTVADALMEELRRVRDEVMPAYLECGAAGRPALILMRADMDRAIRALAEQDAVACLAALESLKELRT